MTYIEKNFYVMHSDLCKMLSHPKRQAILDALRGQELTVSELIQRTGISQSNLSQHLGLLRSKGVLKIRRESHRVFYSISNLKIVQAFDLISEMMQEILTAQNRTVNNVRAQQSR